MKAALRGWTDNPEHLSSTGEGGEAVLRHNGKKVSHARITLLTNKDGLKLSDRELRSLCLHEIGHALGLMEHSPCPDDVMFPTLASVADTSDRDFRILKQVYKQAL